MKLLVNILKGNKIEFLAKGNNFRKSRLNTTRKSNLMICGMSTQIHIYKFQVDITKDEREKTGKLYILQRAITNVK